MIPNRLRTTANNVRGHSPPKRASSGKLITATNTQQTKKAYRLNSDRFISVLFPGHEMDHSTSSGRPTFIRTMSEKARPTLAGRKRLNTGVIASIENKEDIAARIRRHVGIRAVQGIA